MRERINPWDIVRINLQERVVVQLKGTRKLTGILCGYDPHLNLMLRNVTETSGDPSTSTTREFPLLFVRGDTVAMVASAGRGGQAASSAGPADSASGVVGDEPTAEAAG
eukprot:TRINITY_DN45975_c0_g1_i1.p3 TRINITY_DN45975_c0_g1~~TRINITY_DN45975_c0_g1_i1.p3  ORF type:complete len:109 (+),score=5.12 TRINITY_DN45975_c0_g1_i1:205-531(+)